jgi:succinate dehydrogenase / fumarate reductase iron-sulfur subunit
MTDKITASVFRFNPEKDSQPYFRDYQVAPGQEMSVLVMLDRIQREQDPTLSFRSYCCGLQNCRSCLMKINGSRRFACLTIVKPGETVKIEPLSFPEAHIKDLVTRFAEK